MPPINLLHYLPLYALAEGAAHGQPMLGTVIALTFYLLMIIVAASCSFNYLFIVDKDANPINGIINSVKLFYSNWSKALLIVVAPLLIVALYSSTTATAMFSLASKNYPGLALLISTCVAVSVIWLLPFMTLLKTNLYEHLSARNESSPDHR